MYGEAPKELYLSKEQKVMKMSEIDLEETTEKISALEKVTKAELNKCNTIEDKMEWLGKVLGQAIFENDMNYAVWVNVQKNNIIEQLKKENEQLKAYESHWKEIEEDAKVIAKENAELKSKNCWKPCEYAEPKSQWVSHHIQDIERLNKAKEIIQKLYDIVCGRSGDDQELLNRAEQFISELEK